jgi:hypothetical protein
VIKLTNGKQSMLYFYRHDLLSVISTKTFWFNEHPSTTGAAWGAKHP